MKEKSGSNDARPGDYPNSNSEGQRPPLSFDQYINKIDPAQRAQLPRDVMRRIRNSWITDRSRIESQQGSEVHIQETDSNGPRISFEEYRETAVNRVVERTGDDLSSVISVVAKHWGSTDWNEPSSSGREGD